jgi:hypothetical protein
MNEKEALQDLLYQNATLKVQMKSLEDQLDRYKQKLAVLSKMTDEWAKSYDNLLKDFIAYRDRSKG